MCDVHTFVPQAPTQGPAFSTASTLLEWPLDIVMIILEHCARPVLASLARTCKVLRACSIPILYRDLDLSCTQLNVPIYVSGRPQQATIGYILRNPSIARNVKSFKFTLGCFCNARPDRALYRMMSLLVNVENVEIDGHPLGLYPVIEQCLTDDLFPNAKSIKIGGSMPFYMAEKILLGCYKPFLHTVVLADSLTLRNIPEEIMGVVETKDSWLAVVYLGVLLSWRTDALERLWIDGKEKAVRRLGDGERKRRGLKLEDVRWVGDKCLKTWRRSMTG